MCVFSADGLSAAIGPAVIQHRNRPRRPPSPLATRALLLLGGLATIATSAVVDPQITASERIELTGRDPVHVVVRANREVGEQVDSLLVTATLRGRGVPVEVRVIPDDPALAVQTVSLDAGDASVSWVHLAGSPPDPDQGQFACPPAAPCELGFTVEPAGAEDLAVELQVDASAVSTADQSFCFPDESDFPQGAAIEIRFDAAL